VGGKGFDASVVLQALGVANLAVGFVAGQIGKQLAQLLQEYGIPTDLVWVEGETRIAHVLVETSLQRHSHIVTSGYQVTPQAEGNLLRKAEEHLPEANWVIAAGSLPIGMDTGFYASLVTKAHHQKVPALIDCSGEPMRQCLRARPDIIKMNRAEFTSTFQTQADPEKQLLQAVREIQETSKLPAIVVTSGEEGILAATGEGTFIACSPAQPVVNAAGAGDAASAALAWRLAEGDPWPEALRWSAAVGAAVVLTPGTADCRMEDVHRILLQTTVRLVGNGDTV
jgi:1-phosphofructokinase family hexose kinase